MNENTVLSKEINEYAELNKENQQYIDDLNVDITDLKISVSSFDESEVSIVELEERIQEEIDKNKESSKNKEQQIEQISIDTENLKNTVILSYTTLEQAQTQRSLFLI